MIRIRFRDIEWIFVLFGTAVGAGILFLPLQASISGFIPLIICSVIIFPVVYLAERNLTEIILKEEENLDITEVFYKKLGHKFAFISTIIYFLSCYTVIIAYADALPNTVSEALNLYGITQADFSKSPLFCFIILIIPVLIMVCRRELMLNILSIILYPLIICILIISFYLIPEWNINNINLGVCSLKGIFLGLLTVFPILVFSLNFCQSISQMVFYYKERNDNTGIVNRKVIRNVFIGTLFITFFTLFFIYSSILAVPAEKIENASKANLSILSVIANSKGVGVLHYIAPIIALTAILSSFLGVFLGTLESCNGLILQALKGLKVKHSVNQKFIGWISIGFIFISLYIVAVCDLKILIILGFFTAPSIAILVFILPSMLKLFKKSELNYKDFTIQILLLCLGLVITSGYIIKTFI
ncbi:MAG: hypothetical protein K9M56_05565 [Victivallales bacterium]|nr:hypothetical protein [Victivallales bacterium]